MVTRWVIGGPKERIKCESNRIRDIVIPAKIYEFINSCDLL